LKVIRQKGYTFSVRTEQKTFLLLREVVLHYKIIPACNMCHSSAIPGIIKQLAALTSKKFAFLLVRVTSLLQSLDIDGIGYTR
jgi:hypothetical protein